MLKPKAPAPAAAPPKVTGTFVTCAKVSQGLYEAFSITVVDGVVVSIRSTSRAPDGPAMAVGVASRDLWTCAKTQTSESFK